MKSAVFKQPLPRQGRPWQERADWQEANSVAKLISKRQAKQALREGLRANPNDATLPDLLAQYFSFLKRHSA